MISPAFRRVRSLADVAAVLATLPARPAALPPLTPAAYVRLRRTAAGLSIEQVAERIEPRIAARRDVATMLRMIEREGVTARDVETLLPLTRVFPFDPDVYMQLRHEPASRHPAVCRGCGCSRGQPCRIVEHGSQAAGECSIEQDGMCSICTTFAGARQ